MLDVDCSTKSSDVLRHIVAEDNRSHGRLACARTPHEQHLALLLALATLRRAHIGKLLPEYARSLEGSVYNRCTDMPLSRCTYIPSTGAEARANSLALAVTTRLGVDFSCYTSSTGACILSHRQLYCYHYLKVFTRRVFPLRPLQQVRTFYFPALDLLPQATRERYERQFWGVSY
jgi:hypothetical protein